ncbi:MAG: threonine ammonia-lyase, biosynthetic [Psittacicella sp.]
MNTNTFNSNDYMRFMLTSQVYDLAIKTPCVPMLKLSKRVNNQVFIKREDTQVVNSFKIRGAYSMLAKLTKEQQLKGVVAASAGNHAQGVALSAKHLKIKALIVMPEKTPSIKVDAVKNFGGEVLLFGNNFDDAKNKAIEISKEKDMIFIPPFDHPLVIAGQGTIGLECLQQCPDVDKIFVPVGGGGIAAGIAVIVKQLNPKIKVIGVESSESACLKAALEAGKPVVLKRVGLFADGVAVKQIGNETFRLCKEYLDDVITVSEDEICASIKDIFDDTRAIAEPAGAVSLAGVKKYISQHNICNEKIINILSGANLNFHRLRYVSERCEIGENQEALLAVKIPEESGSFLKLCENLGNTNITEFSYRYLNNSQARVFMGLQIQNSKQKEIIIEALEKKEFNVKDISNDDVAKTHIRYMIGGTSSSQNPEKLYQVIFPEEKGALIKFLNTIGKKWNISLFHYRNHGANYGDILIGFQVQESEYELLNSKLKEVGYQYTDVTNSLAYDNFLNN